jgi:hypothetical protein
MQGYEKTGPLSKPTWMGQPRPAHALFDTLDEAIEYVRKFTSSALDLERDGAGNFASPKFQILRIADHWKRGSFAEEPLAPKPDAGTVSEDLPF